MDKKLLDQLHRLENRTAGDLQDFRDVSTDDHLAYLTDGLG